MCTLPSVDPAQPARLFATAAEKRELTGETAYDRYLEHHATEHGVPRMTRREFERDRAERSAQPGSRCC